MKNRNAILKNMRILLMLKFFIIFCSATSFAQYPAGSPVAINGKLRVIGTKLSNECGNPVQLRGMSSHGVQWFPNCYSTSALDALTNSWKIDVFRIAMYVQEGGYVNNPTYWKGWIDNMVNECGKRGIYCMIDWHVLSPGDPMANINEAREFWTYMSAKHAGKKHVLYEICNEPNGVDWARVKTYADDIIPRIRANDPSTIVIVGTPTWSQDVDIAANNKLSYSNIMYTLHFYSGTHTDYLRSKANTAISKGLALFVTEFGTSLASGDGGPYLAEGDKWMSWMAANNISWINWSFADKAEVSAALAPGACGGNWNNTSQSGTWIKQKLTVPADNFVCNNSNQPPTVSISSPSNGSSFSVPASVTINATAADVDGTVSKVEFFNGTNKLGEDLTSPYSFSWSGVAAGSYTITAKATDNEFATTTSTGVNITVTTTTVNTPPTVSIASPSNGASFVAPASITINANAADANGTVSKVEFYNGSTKLGEDFSSPYSFTWSNVAAGSYTITARATDNALATTTSAAVNISVTTSSVNTPPTVSISSPSNGAGFVAPASITINANAADANGTVSKVEFFSGATKLGEDLTSPYSFTWSNVAAGSYTITAKATDNALATTISAPVSVTVSTGSTTNQSPVVSITAPLNGTRIATNSNIIINANASDPDGTISKVEFFSGNTKLGEDFSSPYSFTWRKVRQGNYSLTAKATDNKGAVTTSAAISITVGNPTTPTNQIPVVSITSPSNSASFAAPATVSIVASASDADGSVTKVEFFNGSVKLGEDLTSPYSFSWSNVPAGNYTLTAKATDNSNAVATSSSVNITVTGGTTTTNCKSTAIPSASAWVLRNAWNDPANGSVITNTTDAMKVTHRQYGLDNVWISESGSPVNLQSGVVYTISFDVLNDAVNSLTGIDVGFGSSVNWDGPVLKQPVVAVATGFSSSSYTRKSVNITSTTSGSAILSLRLKWAGQVTQNTNILIKNISVCSPAGAPAIRIDDNSLLSASTTDYLIGQNPFTETTTVRINGVESTPMNVSVVDLSGRTVLSTNAYNVNESFEIGNELEVGVYLLKATSGDKISVIKLIKE